MSKECKKARNMVISAIMLLLILITIMSMSSCSSTSKMKKCCEKTSQAVYEYEGLVIE